MSGNVPVRVGVITMLVSMPGTRSCFCPIAGIQNEWITSADCSSKVMLRSTGITSSYDLRFLLVRVLEAPGELLREHLDRHRVRARVAVLGEHDGADDADRDHEDRRARPSTTISRPGVPVDRRAVRLVLRRRAERDHRVDEHRHHEREDPDADDRREPVDDPRSGPSAPRPRSGSQGIRTATSATRIAIDDPDDRACGRSLPCARPEVTSPTRRKASPTFVARTRLADSSGKRGLARQRRVRAGQRVQPAKATSSMGREGFEPSTLGLRVPCSTN